VVLGLGGSGRTHLTAGQLRLIEYLGLITGSWSVIDGRHLLVIGGPAGCGRWRLPLCPCEPGFRTDGGQVVTKGPARGVPYAVRSGCERFNGC
jgi:hypothetical protein